MDAQILLNIRPNQTRMAYLEQGGDLKHIFYHQKSNPSQVGAIFKGKVVKIFAGLNFAFIDLGSTKAGFLYGKDLPRNQRKVGDALKVGQELLAQIKTDPVRDKGPRLTTEISLPGFFMVFVPSGEKKIVFSRRISEEKERKRLADIFKEFNVSGTLIVRTLAQGRSLKELKKDFEFLKSQWAELNQKFKTQNSYGKVRESEDPVKEYLKNLISEDVKQILIDEEVGYSDIKKWLKENHSEDLAKKISRYRGKDPLFSKCNLESQIGKLQKKKVYLRNGGTLIFEELEAFVIIDVNTARYKGKGSSSESILSLNLEAARMIAKQIILRELGGIVLIDFIDMEEQEDRRKIVSCLEAGLKKDKTKTKVYPMGDLGLVQITRKRKNLSLSGTLKTECFHCSGEGSHKKTSTLSGELFLKLEEYGPGLKIPFFSKNQKVKVTCHPRLKKWIEAEEQENIEFLRKNFSVEPDFKGDLECKWETFQIEKA